MLLAVLVVQDAAALPSGLVPFQATGDLFVLEGSTNNILRIDQNTQAISVAVPSAQILAATGDSSARFVGAGMAFDSAGNLYFTTNTNIAGTEGGHLLKWNGSSVSVIATRAAIEAVTGSSISQPVVAVGDDGFVYVAVGDSNIVKVDPSTAALSLHTSRAAFQAAAGHLDVIRQSGITPGTGGTIYVALTGNPDSREQLFRVNSDGTLTLLHADSPFTDLDADLTRRADGAILTADHAGGSASSNAVYLSDPSLASVPSLLLGPSDLSPFGVIASAEMGMAYDSFGNLFLVMDQASETRIVLFNPLLTGSVYADATDIAIFLGENDPSRITIGDIALEFNEISGTAVPEPTTLISLIVGVPVLFRRKRCQRTLF